MYIVKTPLLEFTLPADWSEVSLRQFLDLQATQSLISDDQPGYRISDVLRCLSSDAQQVDQLTDAEQELLLQRLAFIGRQPDFSQFAKPVRLNGVSLPHGLGHCTLLQKWTVEAAIGLLTSNGHSINYVSLAVPVLCVYLYPLLTGRPFTDANQVEEILAQVESLPVTTALPVSAFFVNRLTDLTPTDDTVYTLIPPPIIKLSWPQRLQLRWRRLRHQYPYERQGTPSLKFY